MLITGRQASAMEKDEGQCLGLRGLSISVLLILLITVDVQIAMAQLGCRNCSGPGVDLRHAQIGKGTARGLVWWRRELNGLHVGPTRIWVFQ